MYDIRPDDELSQGDILRRVRIVDRTSTEELSEIATVHANVIVLTQNCEIDKIARGKTKVGHLLVAIVSDLITLGKGQQGHVRKNAVNSLFYLPQEGPMPIEAYIDWRTIQPVELWPVWEARSQHERYVCTVEGDLLKAASERMWDFFFRPIPFDPVREPLTSSEEVL